MLSLETIRALLTGCEPIKLTMSLLAVLTDTLLQSIGLDGLIEGFIDGLIPEFFKHALQQVTGVIDRLVVKMKEQFGKVTKYRRSIWTSRA